MSEPEYNITKDDIAVMVRYLRATAPEYAPPEKAIFLLEHYDIHYKNLEALHPGMIEELLKGFEKR